MVTDFCGPVLRSQRQGGAPRPVGLPHWGRSRGCRDASVHVNVALRWDKEHPTVGGLDSDVMWVEPSLAPDARPLAPRLRSPDRRSADLHGRANVLGCSTDGVRARSGACTALARRTWVAARTPRGAVARVPWRVQNLPWCGDSGVERARKRPVAHCRSSRGETTPSRTQPPKGVFGDGRGLPWCARTFRTRLRASRGASVPIRGAVPTVP